MPALQASTTSRKNTSTPVVPPVMPMNTPTVRRRAGWTIDAVPHIIKEPVAADQAVAEGQSVLLVDLQPRKGAAQHNGSADKYQNQRQYAVFTGLRHQAPPPFKVLCAGCPAGSTSRAGSSRRTPPTCAADGFAAWPVCFNRCYVEVAGLIPHGDLLLKGHLPALRVPVSRGQQAVVAALGRIAVQLAFIMPKGDDILLQVGLGAGAPAHGRAPKTPGPCRR